MQFLLIKMMKTITVLNGLLLKLLFITNNFNILKK